MYDELLDEVRRDKVEYYGTGLQEPCAAEEISRLRIESERQLGQAVRSLMRFVQEGAFIIPMSKQLVGAAKRKISRLGVS